MKKSIFAFGSVFLFLILGLSISIGADAGDLYEQFPKEKNVFSNKSWTLQFTKPVHFRDINDSSLYVVDDKGIMVEGIRIVYEHTKPYDLVIRPPKKGWETGRKYTIFASSEIVSNEGEKLEKPVKMSFEAGYENGKITLAIEQSNSIRGFYRGFVQTSNKHGKYYAIYEGNGDMLTNIKPTGEKAIFVLEDKDNTGVITVKTFSTYSELDLVESRDFLIESD